MVHADSALLPSSIRTKSAFYTHLQEQLQSLLSSQRTWLTNLSNASSILHASLNSWRVRAAQIAYEEQQQQQSSSSSSSAAAAEVDATAGKALNWTGFYLLSSLFPHPRPPLLKKSNKKLPTIYLGPFHGLPACQAIPSVPQRGVCADGSSVWPPTTIRVADTEAYPGHIACDSLSKSELVVPLVVPIARLSKQHQDLVRRARDGRSSEEELQTDDDDDLFTWASRLHSADQGSVIVGLLDIDCVELDGFDEVDQRELEQCVRIVVDSCDW